ncbi:MAG TPA: hypothetical protein VIV14_06275 [Gammaproteobacteria bacterium]
MKLRIRGDSVRLRLSQTETVQLSEQGFVADSIGFAAGNGLEYRIEAAAGASVVTAFDGRRILVTVPEPMVRAWLEPAEVSISAEQELEPGRRLRVLIEKDFTCLTPREGEDDSDSFPNPDAGAK